MTALAEARAVLADLIAFPTVSADGNLGMIAYLAERLGAAGARVEIQTDPSGRKANLFATLGPEAPGGILLSGHTDVVPAADQDWASDPFAMVERGGRLYGRGTCDMKGFIAAALCAATGYAARPLARPVHFAFTYDEEVGCLGARQLVGLIRGMAHRPAMAIIGEPTEMRVIEGHKGCHEYTTRFTGLEGHGSAPDLGVSAVDYAVRYVTRLLELREDMKSRAPPESRFDPPWTTMNVGRLSGGVAHNVIAGRAEVDWEMRPARAADAEIVMASLGAYCDEVLLPAMRAVAPDAAIETEVIGQIAGLEPMPRNAARDLLAELTGANAAELVPFGTEAGLFQACGIEVAVCGPGSIAQAHKPDEYLALDQLAQCLDMLDRLGERLETPAPARN